MLLFIFLVSIAYLLGSISSAILVCKLSGFPDPREHGSKNPGATNVLRLAGKQYAALVLLIDALKGTIPVLIAKGLDADPALVGFTALAAVLGHMYPVFFGFKGGKGVATAIGALIGFQFIIGVMVAATWLLVANFTRYASLASIIAISLAPFYALVLIGRLDVFPPLVIIAIFVLFKHNKNISRLFDGTEPKIHLKKTLLKEVMDDEKKSKSNTEKELEKEEKKD